MIHRTLGSPPRRLVATPSLIRNLRCSNNND